MKFLKKLLTIATITVMATVTNSFATKTQPTKIKQSLENTIGCADVTGLIGNFLPKEDKNNLRLASSSCATAVRIGQTHLDLSKTPAIKILLLLLNPDLTARFPSLRSLILSKSEIRISLTGEVSTIPAYQIPNDLLSAICKAYQKLEILNYQFWTDNAIRSVLLTAETTARLPNLTSINPVGSSVVRGSITAPILDLLYDAYPNVTALNCALWSNENIRRILLNQDGTARLQKLTSLNFSISSITKATIDDVYRAYPEIKAAHDREEQTLLLQEAARKKQALLEQVALQVALQDEESRRNNNVIEEVTPWYKALRNKITNYLKKSLTRNETSESMFSGILVNPFSNASI